MTNTVLDVFEMMKKRIPGLTKDQFLKEWWCLPKADREYALNMDIPAFLEGCETDATISFYVCENPACFITTFRGFRCPNCSQIGQSVIVVK